MMRKVSDKTESKEVGLTIYNGGFGAVKETRELQMTGHEEELVFADVAQLIETNSLMVEGIQVLEFNYDFDLVDRMKLLQRYMDKEVFLKDRKTGQRKSCRLLSVNRDGNYVLEDNSTREIYLDSKDEIILPSLPSGLMVKPALVWKIEPSLTSEVRVSYLSGGLNWTANYVILVQQHGLEITGWAAIENTSGTTFDNARIKLIAGEVNRAKQPERIYESARMVLSADQVKEKAFFDYHMYTLPNATTLKDNQTKQISLLTGTEIGYKRIYQLNLREEDVDSKIKFSNTQGNGLGIALPEGVVKLYQLDEDDGSLEFIGEDRIGHTPKDEDIQLTLGKAFDIVFDLQVTDKRKPNRYEYTSVTVNIRNHKEEPVEVYLEYPIWGLWEMVKASHPYQKKEANLVAFSIQVLPSSPTKLSFEYRIDRGIEIIIKEK